LEEGWERPPRLELSLTELCRLIEPAFPGVAIAEHSVLVTGLANTNIRFRLDGHELAYVLRLHTRDSAAATRERELMSYLAGNQRGTIPVAPLVYSDCAPQRGRHPYSIWGFVEGTLLQDLFKSDPLDRPRLIAETTHVVEETVRMLT
jgi:aminoglycoside phosphotransferase (APT) family kinase protein